MHWIDYVIIALPVALIVFIALRTRKYVRNVSDFLTAGRVAGRYVVAVAGGEANLGLVSVVAMMEMYYNTGFGVVFWTKIGSLVTFFYSLTGFCHYRFRETRAMTLGQFLGMRYGRNFRFVAAIFQSVSGILNYALFPAVGARFLIYYLDLPFHIGVFGMQFPTFGVLMAGFLGLALAVTLLGGQVTIMVTDCVQGILSYPLYMVLVVFVLVKFSWAGEMAPSMLIRPPGESLLDPYDISKLRDFNLFFVLAGVYMSFFYRMTWSGAQGFNAAAVSAHEQKMSGLLGYWRNGFSVMMYILLAVAAITYLNHGNYRTDALRVDRVLTQKAIDDVASADPGLHASLSAVAAAAEADATESTAAERKSTVGRDRVEEVLKAQDKSKAQTFGTIYRQMQVSVAVKDMLPAGITGIFCAIMIILLITTDTAYMHSWGSILAQDLILPLLKRPLTPKEQLLLLRCCIASVAVFAFLFSLLYSQIDYILMFFAITGAIWSAGAGPAIVFGLYSRRGNTAGAFTSLFTGSVIAVGGIFCQQKWAETIYPFLERHGLVRFVSDLLTTLSKPLNPYVIWEVTPYKFPINSQEMAVISLTTSVVLYLAASYITGRGRLFNLDAMLHRGQYRVEEIRTEPAKIGFLSKFVNITPEYTKGDRILAWSSFAYNVIFNTVICFVLVIAWNMFQKWTPEAWGWYFYVTNILVAGVIALVSTFWFSICGTKDLIRLFKRLEEKKSDDSDDGRTGLRPDEVKE